MNVCGEGGEYETLTLDTPMFRQRLVMQVPVSACVCVCLLAAASFVFAECFLIVFLFLVQTLVQRFFFHLMLGLRTIMLFP